MQTKSNLQFMCVGAQKSGTTWLYHQLSKHPEVSLPPLKEIHYFDENLRNVKTDLISRLFDKHWMNKRWRGINVYLLKKIAKFNVKEASWFMSYLYGTRDFDWYANLFKTTDGKISGDITPDYAALTIEQIKEIKQHSPNLKIIFLMRDPVERRWSQIKMVLGEKRNRDFKDVPKAEYLEACNNWEDELGQYSLTLENWSSVFGTENVFAGFYDDLKQDPATLYKQILEFLDLRLIFDESDLKKVVYGGGSNSKIPNDALEIIVKQKHNEVLKLKEKFGQLPAGWLQYFE